MHLSTFIYNHLHLSTYMYIYLHLYTFIFIYLHLSTSIYIYIHLFTFVYIYQHAFTFIKLFALPVRVLRQVSPFFKSAHFCVNSLLKKQKKRPKGTTHEPTIAMTTLIFFLNGLSCSEVKIITFIYIEIFIKIYKY